MKPIHALLLASAVLVSSCGQAVDKKQAEMDRFVSDLMSKMTVEEKIGQLNLSGGDIPGVLSGTDGLDEAIRQGLLTSTGWNNVKELRRLQEIAVNETRLGIPLMCGLDVIHGFGTIFPIPLAISCSWDTTLVERSARIAAVEASANGCNWTYSPMVDIARDARWGRIAEGSGEDPWLGARMAAAMVRGYQGDNLADSTTILACVKHFALYGAAEAGRDYNTVDMSKVRMYNEYLAPYKGAVDAGCGSAMSSFNVVEGVPASGNRWLLTDLLRGQWGFKGFVVSDYDSVGEMMQHGLGDLQEVSAKALTAGLDMDMMTSGYVTTLKKSLEEGRISQKDIDTACRRILEAKYKLGLFEDPYRYLDEDRAEKDFMTEEHLEFARLLAAKSIVLLKNDKRVLPLEKKGTIAVVGPMAFTKEDLLGMWSGTNDQKSATIADAFKEAVGSSARIIEAKGCHLTDDAQLAEVTGLTPDPADNSRLIREAVSKSAGADVIVAVLGEPRSWTGEACSRADIGLPQSQKDLLKALLGMRKPLVLVLANGRPMTLEWEDANCPAIIEAWHGGAEAARALTDVIFGDVNPSGKLTATFPRTVGQIPIYYNHLNTGRPRVAEDHYTSKYLDIPNEPLYPFGYGLSYTEFKYSDITLSKTSLKGDEILTASVEVTNVGDMEGEETVQLYIGDPAASISRPLEELKGFQKISLKPGESQTVSFRIGTDLLKFYNSDLEYVWEPGQFNIFIGASSADVRKASVTWEN